MLNTKRIQLNLASTNNNCIEIEEKEEYPKEPVNSKEETITRSSNLYNPILFNFQGFSNQVESEQYKYILSKIRNDDLMNINQKCAFTSFLLFNPILLNNDFIKEFLDEECHLTLMNWIYNEKNILRSPNEDVDLSNFYLVLGLLINILNIFELLPIKSNDLILLKLYDKLLKINEYINLYVKQNTVILNCVQHLLKKWEKEIRLYKEAKFINDFIATKLGVKTKRSEDKANNEIPELEKPKKVKKEKEDKEDTEADSEDCGKSSNKNKLNHKSIIKSDNNIIKINKKNKRVSFDFQKNIIIKFNPNDTPQNKPKSKSQYDPLLDYMSLNF